MVTLAKWAKSFKRQSIEDAAFCQRTLSADLVETACTEVGHQWRQCFWTPPRIVWTFLMQVLHPGHSCRAAVAMALAEAAAAEGDPGLSADPSAYSQARTRLPLDVLRRCLRAVGEHLRQAVSDVHLWHGHRVWLVDGTRCRMPDTPSLQKAFGQPSGQEAGCGFPVATITAVFCWASGAVLDAAIGPYRDSELRLWRTLWSWLRPGDLIVGDRLYCSYADLGGLVTRGCDAVCRLHQRRKVDWRAGERLGPNERLATWTRPQKRYRGRNVSVRQWRRLPETLTVRIIRGVVGCPGFRTRHIVVATTLLNPKAYPAEDILALYGDRWTVELRLRDLKTTLGMDMLRCMSPAMVRKEITMHLLAYNLIRQVMAAAAAQHGRDLHRLSFAGTLQRLDAVLPCLAILTGRHLDGLLALLLRWVAADTVPLRPGRVEPRARKQRPKKYKLLNKPRQQLRQELILKQLVA